MWPKWLGQRDIRHVPWGLSCDCCLCYKSSHEKAENVWEASAKLASSIHTAIFPTRKMSHFNVSLSRHPPSPVCISDLFLGWMDELMIIYNVHIRKHGLDRMIQSWMDSSSNTVFLPPLPYITEARQSTPALREAKKKLRGKRSIKLESRRQTNT